MDWNDLEKHFSPARLGRYRAAYQGNSTKAAAAYSYNLLLAEAMVPLLNVLEIALRNGIHKRMIKMYGRTDWWALWEDSEVFSWQMKEVINAKTKLSKRMEAPTSDKIVAELTFAFWSSLFNSQFTNILWKDLRLVFPRCPKSQRKRRTISSALNQIRDLRNRIFHHEPLLWLTPSLKDLHALGIETIGWIEPKLVDWLTEHDRLPATWHTWKSL